MTMDSLCRGVAGVTEAWGPRAAFNIVLDLEIFPWEGARTALRLHLARSDLAVAADALFMATAVCMAKPAAPAVVESLSTRAPLLSRAERS